MSLVWEKPCQKFPLDLIQKATNNFDKSKIIGKGGFGEVYKGVVHDGSTTTVVAVKRLNPESKQGIREFETEIKTLSKCRHSHLVSLVGYCNEHQEMILVYEYMPRGTLADHLFKNQDFLLEWEQRLQICIGAARGLDYLHTGFPERVIHLDIKSANILLDDNWAAKIADLGLSRTGPANQPHSEVITEHVRGTRGYIDPQYLKFYRFSRKADVYAFGVVLLEVLSGTRMSTMGGEIIPDPELTDLADWVQQHISNKTLNQIIDPRVVREIEPRCLNLFADTTSKCLLNDPDKRPSMSKVVAELESALAYQKDTNPSSSIIEGSLFEHFNAVSIQTRPETTLKDLSVDTGGSLEHHSVNAESEQEDFMEPEDSAILSITGIPVNQYLGMAHNIFGEPIRNKAMVQMGLRPTRKNKAMVAYSRMDKDYKYVEALTFVKGLKAQWGNGISTLCLLYNATGETLTYATSRNWFGDIGPSPYPSVILNGQWGAFLHVKTPRVPSGSVAAVVYRCKCSDSAFYDYLIGWSTPWQRITHNNTAYCAINQVGYFDGAVWDAIYNKISCAAPENIVKFKDCRTRVSIESETSPIYKAVLTHIDAGVCQDYEPLTS